MSHNVEISGSEYWRVWEMPNDNLADLACIYTKYAAGVSQFSRLQIAQHTRRVSSHLSAHSRNGHDALDTTGMVASSDTESVTLKDCSFNGYTKLHRRT